MSASRALDLLTPLALSLVLFNTFIFLVAAQDKKNRTVGTALKLFGIAMLTLLGVWVILLISLYAVR